MEEANILKASKVGDQVVRSSRGEYSFVTITKKTDKIIYIGDTSYYVPKHGWKWTERARGYSGGSLGNLFPATERYVEEVRKTQERQAEKQRQLDNKKAEEASDLAEYKAFAATEEGKAFIALKEDWVGTKLIVETSYDFGSRRARIFIAEPNGHRVFGGEVSVDQKLDSWSKDTLIEPAEINHGAMVKNVGQTEAYIQALQKAVAIAKVWNLDVGKKWDKDAQMAVKVEEHSF